MKIDWEMFVLAMLILVGVSFLGTCGYIDIQNSHERDMTCIKAKGAPCRCFE